MVGRSGKGMEQRGPFLPLPPHLESAGPSGPSLTDSAKAVGPVRTHQGRLVSGSELNLQAR